MTRTLALRIYNSSGYAEGNLVDGAGYAVQIIYAMLVGDEFYHGGVVPGATFTHAGNGVWVCDIDSSLLDDSRTDYYYVQYMLQGRSNWTDVVGFDPFYFKTKPDGGTSYTYVSGITNYTPDVCSIAESQIDITITAPTLYTGGNGAIAPSHTRCISYSMSATTAPGAYTEVPVQSGILTIPRSGASFNKSRYIHTKVRIYNPVTNEYSQSSANYYALLSNESLGELTAARLTDPAPMDTGDATEVSMYGDNDSLQIKMPAIPVGAMGQLAIQFGDSGTPPTINEDADGFVNFSGTIMSCSNSIITVPKPPSTITSLTVYLARRITGYDGSSKWVGGAEAAEFYAQTIDAASRYNMLSTDIINAIASAVSGKIVTADGQNLEIKQGT